MLHERLGQAHQRGSARTDYMPLAALLVVAAAIAAPYASRAGHPTLAAGIVILLGGPAVFLFCKAW